MIKMKYLFLSLFLCSCLDTNHNQGLSGLTMNSMTYYQDQKRHVCFLGVRLETPLGWAVNVSCDTPDVNWVYLDTTGHFDE